MKPNYRWVRVTSSLPNLNVLVVEGVEVGFVYKPHDPKTDKNEWRIHRDIGDNTKFLAWNPTKTGAQRFLEKVLVGA
jgi:hypothetical protein